MVALYVAYDGAGYLVSHFISLFPQAFRLWTSTLDCMGRDVLQGMQANPGKKTIEADLEAAIHRAGGISEQNAGSFKKVDPTNGPALAHCLKPFVLMFSSLMAGKLQKWDCCR